MTERERHVLTAVAADWTNAEIAEQLHRADPTVASPTGHVLAKIEARDRVQACSSPTAPDSCSGRKPCRVPGPGFPREPCPGKALPVCQGAPSRRWIPQGGFAT
ncbi:response regulator transcription factor [Streptomyces flaveolus]|uniref:response regulator transcription factor n=1 Tax=Streptomyces flaveolus TaxID=67297 RepID=UPI0033E52194